MRFARKPSDRGTLVIRRIIAPGICLGAALWSGSAVAEDQASAILDYVAPPECPPAATFQQAVVTRLPVDHSVNLGAIPEPVNGRLGLQVRVSKTPGGYRAELTTVTDEGRSSPRNLDGPVCAELMDAMAFTAALTVDPNATSVPAPTKPREAATPLEAEAPPNATNAARVEAHTSETLPDRNDEREEEPLGLEEETPERPHVPLWSISVAAGIVLTAPVSPGVSPGALAGLRYSDEAPGSWSPAVTVAFFGSRLVASYSPTASFTSAGVHLEFCPSSFRDRTITIRPCVAGQLTMLQASGENLTHPTDVTVALPSLGAHVELRHALSSQWFLGGVVGAQAGLQSHRFDVGRPAEELATTRPVAPFVSLQVGAFLP